VIRFVYNERYVQSKDVFLLVEIQIYFLIFKLDFWKKHLLQYRWTNVSSFVTKKIQYRLLTDNERNFAFGAYFRAFCAVTTRQPSGAVVTNGG
jgi:hypothetical protein